MFDLTVDGKTVQVADDDVVLHTDRLVDSRGISYPLGKEVTICSLTPIRIHFYVDNVQNLRR